MIQKGNDPGSPFETMERQETCSVATARRVAAMLDHDPDAIAAGVGSSAAARSNSPTRTT